MKRSPGLSLVMPAYNEEANVGAAARACAAAGEKFAEDYEVIVVDDGSRDRTSECVQAEARTNPRVRLIRLPQNRGFGGALKTGLKGADKPHVFYTDSDCEADEDWLYYSALALVRSPHVGMGGPNLIPDEGSWIADCVGLSPGGPTHVMIDDRTAEHVPGCNMAYYTRVAKEINGFDSQFRAANISLSK